MPAESSNGTLARVAIGVALAAVLVGTAMAATKGWLDLPREGVSVSPDSAGSWAAHETSIVVLRLDWETQAGVAVSFAEGDWVATDAAGAHLDAASRTVTLSPPAPLAWTPRAVVLQSDGVDGAERVAFLLGERAVLAVRAPDGNGTVEVVVSVDGLRERYRFERACDVLDEEAGLTLSTPFFGGASAGGSRTYRMTGASSGGDAPCPAFTLRAAHDGAWHFARSAS